MALLKDTLLSGVVFDNFSHLFQWSKSHVYHIFPLLGISNASKTMIKLKTWNRK